MKRRAGQRIAVQGRDAEERHAAGNAFEDVGKVLAAHARCRGFDVGVARQVSDDGDGAGIVDGGGVAELDLYLRRAAVGECDVRANPLEGGAAPRATGRREGAQCTEQVDGFGQDIVGRAGVDAGDRQDDRVGGDRSAPRNLGLECEDDFGGDRDRVERIVGHRRVTALADDSGAQRIGRSEHRPGTAGDGAAGQIGPDVEREGGVRRGIVEHPLRDHLARAVMPLLPRLEHEQDAARERVAAGRKYSRSGGKHGRMAVVAAGVHRAFGPAGEIEPGRLADRKRVHVAAK